jgi:hypothetical protein
MNKTYEAMIQLSARVSGHADVQCLLGLGSMAETSRLDHIRTWIFLMSIRAPNPLARDFMGGVSPIAYSFRNTVDGYKVLFANGVFAEFAVFEPDEMAHIGFTKGRLIYKRPDFDESLAVPRLAPKKEPLDIDYCVNEALTNLYIGVLRELRGEKAAAMTCIQDHAANQIMKLFEHLYHQRAKTTTHTPSNGASKRIRPPKKFSLD